MAQEVERVFPELVTQKDHGTLENRRFLNYEGLIPVLVEAIKTQQRMIESQNTEMMKMKRELFPEFASTRFFE